MNGAVEGLDGLEVLLESPVPLYPGRRVGTPSGAGDLVDPPGGHGLEGNVDFGTLRWN